MSRDRRDKASDVFRNSKPLLGTTTSFDAAFPGVESVEVEVEELGDCLPGGSRLSRLDKRNFPECFDCHNPRCYGGGVGIGAILRGISYDKRTQFEETTVCNGYEGSPKGRKNYGPCDHMFKIKLSVTYKE